MSAYRFAVVGFAVVMFMGGANALYAAAHGDVPQFAFCLAAAAYFGWLVWLVDSTEVPA